MNLKGPHFAVASGFSSVSQQRASLCQKLTFFPCLGLGVSEALLLIFLPSVAREAVLHFITSLRKVTAALVSTRGLGREHLPLLFIES